MKQLKRIPKYIYRKRFVLMTCTTVRIWRLTSVWDLKHVEPLIGTEVWLVLSLSLDPR